MHRVALAARFRGSRKSLIVAVLAAFIGLLASDKPASAQFTILNLLGTPTNTTAQQLSIVNSTLQQLGVGNALIQQFGLTPAAVQLGIAALQVSLTQTTTAKTVAMISGEVISAQVNEVVSEAFRSPFSGFDSFAAAAPGVYKVAARTKTARGQEWLVWVDARGTGWENHNDTSGLNGAQADLTGGIARKVTPDLLVGAFAGYESVKFNVASLATNTRAQSGSIGSFIGWRMNRNLRLDASITYAHISYATSADAASGSYNGNRWMFTGGATGSYELSGFVVEPSATTFVVWEQQNAWTDSIGSIAPDRRFNAGRVSTGARLIRPWTAGHLNFAPYAGLYGDWRFSSGNALPAGVPVVGIGDGWSARVTSGVTLTTTGPLMVSLGGEYGGIGADYKIWTGNLRGTVRF